MAKQIRYSEEFKRQAVLIYLHGDLSCKQIATSIHVHPNTLSTWIKQFKNGAAPSASLPSKDENAKKHLPDNMEIDSILSAIAIIETQVKIMKKLITDYQ